MTVKTTGAEFKRFYNDATFWPQDAWHEDEEFEVDGEPISEDLAIEDVPDNATVKITGGCVLGLPDRQDGEGLSLESFFKKWRKVQNTVVLVVECDKSILDSLKEAVRAAGGRVL